MMGRLDYWVYQVGGKSELVCFTSHSTSNHIQVGTSKSKSFMKMMPKLARQCQAQGALVSRTTKGPDVQNPCWKCVQLSWDHWSFENPAFLVGCIPHDRMRPAGTGSQKHLARKRQIIFSGDAKNPPIDWLHISHDSVLYTMIYDNYNIWEYMGYHDYTMIIPSYNHIESWDIQIMCHCIPWFYIYSIYFNIYHHLVHLFRVGTTHPRVAAAMATPSGKCCRHWLPGAARGCRPDFESLVCHGCVAGEPNTENQPEKNTLEFQTKKWKYSRSWCVCIYI